MITPAYSVTATERVLPKLALDFTTGALDSRVSVTRALNSATRVNSSGYIETVNANLPRFDYSPTSVGVCKGLLIEEARTNITASSSCAAADWTGVGASLANTGKLSPDGTNFMCRFTEDTATSAHFSFATNTSTIISLSTVYTASVFLAAGTRRYVVVNAGTNGSAWGVTVDTQNWVISGDYFVGGCAYISSTIEPWGNDIYRVTLTGVQNVGGGTQAYIVLAGSLVSDATAANTSYAGTNGTFFYWGVQFEAGAYATSYIPVGTTNQLRNADVATMTGTNFSSWWQSTTGGVSARARQLSVAATSPWLQFDNNTANNIIALRGNTVNPELYIKDTTDQAQIDAGTIDANTNYGLAGAWNTNNCAASLNGAAVVPDTSVTVPTVTQARLGSDGTNYLNGWLQSIRYWPQRITDAEIQAFSKL